MHQGQKNTLKQIWTYWSFCLQCNIGKMILMSAQWKASPCLCSKLLFYFTVYRVYPSEASPHLNGLKRFKFITECGAYIWWYLWQPFHNHNIWKRGLYNRFSWLTIIQEHSNSFDSLNDTSINLHLENATQNHLIEHFVTEYRIKHLPYATQRSRILSWFVLTGSWNCTTFPVCSPKGVNL